MLILEEDLLVKLKNLHDTMVRTLKLNYYKKLKNKTNTCLRGLRKIFSRKS